MEGVFENQEEIDNSAQQGGATVGGLKFVDYNADGVISAPDQTLCGGIFIPISFEGEDPFTQDVIIGK